MYCMLQEAKRVSVSKNRQSVNSFHSSAPASASSQQSSSSDADEHVSQLSQTLSQKLAINNKKASKKAWRSKHTYMNTTYKMSQNPKMNSLDLPIDCSLKHKHKNKNKNKNEKNVDAEIIPKNESEMSNAALLFNSIGNLKSKPKIRSLPHSKLSKKRSWSASVYESLTARFVYDGDKSAKKRKKTKN